MVLLYINKIWCYVLKNDLVVKDNALINASYSLTLTEQRLILLAIVAIREDVYLDDLNLINLLGRPIKITANRYIQTFQIDPSSAYKSLKEACKTLFGRQFSFQEPRERGRLAYKTTRWVSDIAYIDDSATIEFTFAPTVLPLITYLEKHLTSYELEIVANLTSGYAIRLYELLISWRSVGKTPYMDLQEFRQKMGILDHEYKRMELLKRRVLEPSLKQINEHTDIVATYEQHKEGRTIVGFSFRFTQKSNKTNKKEIVRDKDTLDFFTKMTDAQRYFFASKLSEMPEMSKYSQGTESYQQFAVRIADMLLEPEKFKQLYPILEKVGFKE